jgi:hypothetical protein
MNEKIIIFENKCLKMKEKIIEFEEFNSKIEQEYLKKSKLLEQKS